MKQNLYLVLVCEHPFVTVEKTQFVPALPDGVAGYAPIYISIRKALKEWPGKEIKTIRPVELLPVKI